MVLKVKYKHLALTALSFWNFGKIHGNILFYLSTSILFSCFGAIGSRSAATISLCLHDQTSRGFFQSSKAHPWEWKNSAIEGRRKNTYLSVRPTLCRELATTENEKSLLRACASVRAILREPGLTNRWNFKGTIPLKRLKSLPSPDLFFLVESMSKICWLDLKLSAASFRVLFLWAK